MFKVASWNLNSVWSRLNHVTTRLQAREPDVLLLQELKGTEFPSEAFNSLGYESVAVTQKAYNGVAILSRHGSETVNRILVGDEVDCGMGVELEAQSFSPPTNGVVIKTVGSSTTTSQREGSNS
jgi:exonuclease III